MSDTSPSLRTGLPTNGEWRWPLRLIGGTLQRKFVEAATCHVINQNQDGSHGHDDV